MKIYYQIKSESFPIQVAFYSFLGGTILFLIGLVIPLKSDFMILAMTYILVAIFANLTVVLALIIRLITSPPLRRKSSIEILILLTNIPIVALYFFIIYNQNNLF